MPEGSKIFPILIPLVTLIIGWVIGFFDSNNRTAKKIREAEARAEHAQKDAERKIAQAEQQAVLNASVQEDDPGILRIKNAGGSYQVEMDGAAISGALSPDKKKRLIELLTVLRPYLEGGTPRPAASVPPPMPAPTPPASSFPKPASVSRPVSRQMPPEPVKPVEAGIGSLFAPLKKSTAEERPFSSLSIVGQIDFILQERLLNTPLAGQGIRLQESPEGAVEVYVGLQKFPSVDEVTDQTIKALIRAAISEWEEKYTPGG